MNKTSMTYWFPLIFGAGIPVPKTIFVEMTPSCRKVIFDAFDGKGEEDQPPEPFFEKLKEAATEIGLPCFLRTDHTSNKHEWSKACYLDSLLAIPAHVFNIVEFSECASLMGVPWETWAVRELLPTIPYGVCPRYRDFPVCKEFRFFVDDGVVRCFHPYWPLEALQAGKWEPDAPEDVAYADLCSIGDSYAGISVLAEKAGKAVGGSWSIDILETERGWYVTDMAEAANSFHWEGCEQQADRDAERETQQ